MHEIVNQYQKGLPKDKTRDNTYKTHGQQYNNQKTFLLSLTELGIAFNKGFIDTGQQGNKHKILMLPKTLHIQHTLTPLYKGVKCCCYCDGSNFSNLTKTKCTIVLDINSFYRSRKAVEMKLKVH